MNTILRTFVIVFACGAFFTPLLSKPITRKKANDVAKAFFASKDVEGNAILAYPSASTRGSVSSTAPYYIFNSSDNKGFVIVAGDDNAESILGYSESGSFDFDQAPDGLKDLLEAYTKHLPTSQNTGTRATEWKAVAPMLTTKWGQNYPYNQSCPIFFNGKRCLTGCVATAMAQVLYYNYKKYPDKVIKELPRDIPSYECETNWDGYGHLSVEGISEGTTIDWQNMSDEIDGSSNDVSKAAVANLMRYCAVAIQSEFGDTINGTTGKFKSTYFGLDDDGTPSAVIVGADYGFFRYFLTSNKVSIVNNSFAPSSWNTKVYNELINNRPVLFSGGSKEKKNGNHAFVIDGCDANYRFHVNWGWSGRYNGYFNLQTMSPSDMDYSYSPEIIYNITPKEESTEIDKINWIPKNNTLAPVYDLNGRVTVQKKQLPKGVYIIHNKKVIVK